MNFFAHWSLRSKLIALTVLVEVVMISAIVWNSQRLQETHLMAQFDLRKTEISRLLQAALAPTMAQRDYAAVRETLVDAQKLEGLHYLAMFDEEGNFVASAGLDHYQPKNAITLLAERGSTHAEQLDLHLPIELAGRSYGDLLVGIDLSFLNQARQEILVQNLVLALLGMVLSVGALSLITLWLTRRLTALHQASHTLASGLPQPPLPTGVPDDVGQLIDAFNRMAHTLAGRMSELQEAESEQRALACQLRDLAERDPLTSLANRSRFTSELQRLLEHRQRHPDMQGALIYFDIDEFKTINDSFGHRAGDRVLVDTARTVSQLIRTDELLVRLGGDEFAIIVPQTDAAGAQALAERIVNATRQCSFEFSGQRFSLSISLGIALIPEHGDESERLVAHADAAMYQAKAAGKNCWRLYRPELDDSVRMLHQLGWNDSIQKALADDRFVLHFQGVHDVHNGDTVHFEALIRMIDPDDPQALLMPGDFIPAAERSGRIVDIDRWVISRAIELLARHPELHALAVNVSARSFAHPEIVDLVRQKLNEHAIDPRRLMIELTETSALANIADSQRFIDGLRALGCTVCLDDFGACFSSFAYMKQLSAEILKIDGLFIRNLATSPEDQVFVRAIVEVAHGLNKKTVAEFVGDEQTLNILRQLGVDYAQGYYLSRPQPSVGTG